jgi:hypothetical protein
MANETQAVKPVFDPLRRLSQRPMSRSEQVALNGRLWPKADIDLIGC